MAASLFQRVWGALLRRPWQPLHFPKEGIPRIPGDVQVEEENIPGYVASCYCPVEIGEIFQERYQVVGKLGYGVTSTVWLARDLRYVSIRSSVLDQLLIDDSERQHVALKLYVRSETAEDELNTEIGIYERIKNSSKDHLGRSAVRSLLDTFVVNGPSGRHRCLVHQPLWESALKLKHRNDVRRLPKPVIAFLLKRLFHALDYLHGECHVAHTDIKEANILLAADSSILTQFEDEELKKPSPRKTVDGQNIYLSRELGVPKVFGEPVLCDFGSAVPLDDGREHREDIQPDIYRSPEVILDIPWTYSVDIWNVGCVVSINGPMTQN